MKANEGGTFLINGIPTGNFKKKKWNTKGLGEGSSGRDLPYKTLSPLGLLLHFLLATSMSVPF